MFNPKSQYTVIPGEKVPVKDFYDYAEDYVVRPPYQRKNVWSVAKQRALLDSLFRRFHYRTLFWCPEHLCKDRMTT